MLNPIGFLNSLIISIINNNIISNIQALCMKHVKRHLCLTSILSNSKQNVLQNLHVSGQDWHWPKVFFVNKFTHFPNGMFCYLPCSRYLISLYKDFKSSPDVYQAFWQACDALIASIGILHWIWQFIYERNLALHTVRHQSLLILSFKSLLIRCIKWFHLRFI